MKIREAYVMNAQDQSSNKERRLLERAQLDRRALKIAKSGEAIPLRIPREVVIDMEQAMKADRRESRLSQERFRTRFQKDEEADEEIPRVHKLEKQTSMQLYRPRQRHRWARNRRVLLSLKEESPYIFGGKYKPLTLMGLPNEILVLIMEMFYRGLQIAIFKRADLRLNPVHIFGEPSKLPLSILQTSRMLHSLGLQMFRRNARYFTWFKPATLSIAGGTFAWHTELGKPWPQLKRWHLTVTSPDQSNQNCTDDVVRGEMKWLPHYTRLDDLTNLLSQSVTDHLSVAFTNENRLDELKLCLGCENLTDCPKLVEASRLGIMKGLIPFRGKVKKMRVTGTLSEPLTKYARWMEIFIQGYDDTPAGKVSPLEDLPKVRGAPIEAPPDPELPEDDDEYDDDEEDANDAEYLPLSTPQWQPIEPPLAPLFTYLALDLSADEVIPETPCLPLLLQLLATLGPAELKEFNMPPTAAQSHFISMVPLDKVSNHEKGWLDHFHMHETPVQASAIPDLEFLQRPNSYLELAAMKELPKDHLIDLAFLDSSNFCTETCHRPNQEHSNFLTALASLHDSYYNVDFPAKAQWDKNFLGARLPPGPAFLYWPNSDSDLPVLTALPGDVIDLPLVPYVAGDTDIVRNSVHVIVDLTYGTVLVGSNLTGKYYGPSEDGTEPEWCSIRIPRCLAPSLGAYRLVGVNGYPWAPEHVLNYHEDPVKIYQYDPNPSGTTLVSILSEHMAAIRKVEGMTEEQLLDNATMMESVVSCLLTELPGLNGSQVDWTTDMIASAPTSELVMYHLYDATIHTLRPSQILSYLKTIGPALYHVLEGQDVLYPGLTAMSGGGVIRIPINVFTQTDHISELPSFLALGMLPPFLELGQVDFIDIPFPPTLTLEALSSGPFNSPRFWYDEPATQVEQLLNQSAIWETIAANILAANGQGNRPDKSAGQTLIQMAYEVTFASVLAEIGVKLTPNGSNLDGWDTVRAPKDAEKGPEDELPNINPNYDGPDDDGLEWLDDEVFDEATDRRIGEYDWDEFPPWVELDETLKDAVRISADH